MTELNIGSRTWTGVPATVLFTLIILVVMSVPFAIGVIVGTRI